MRSREKKVISLSQEIVELKSAKQQLEEDFTRQRKSLQQQLTKCTTFRNEVQKLNGKNQALTETNTVSLFINVVAYCRRRKFEYQVL